MTIKETPGSLDNPPGQTVELKPGGLHVMFMNVAMASTRETRTRASLTFEGARRETQ